MTWEELEQLPDELAGEIELWDGRVVWVRRGPAEHQEFTGLLWSALRRAVRDYMQTQLGECWRAGIESNVFLSRSGKSNFLTPDFLVYRCLDGEFRDIHAGDVLIAGEVLSPSNTPNDVEAKKLRYAGAGIPWYWEVRLSRSPRGIASVRAYALETGHGQLPPGVRPLRTSNYLITGEWLTGQTPGIHADQPFPIHIPWDELAY